MPEWRLLNRPSATRLRPPTRRTRARTARTAADGPASAGTGPLAGLTSVQRSILRALAFSATPGELWFVERMVRRSGPALEANIEMLIAYDLLHDSDGGLRLRSPAVRRAVLRATPPSLRGAIHVRAAAVLAHPSPTLAAGHLLRALVETTGPEHPGTGTGRLDLALVSRLAVDPAVDPSVAADLLLAVHVRYGPTLAPEHHRSLLPALVDHLMLAGRAEQAMAVLTEEIAADRDGPEQRAILLGRLGAWHATGRPSLALAYLHRALAQERTQPIHRAWLLTTLAAIVAPLGQPAVAELLGEAEQAERETPAPGGAVRLALARSGVALGRGDLRAARRLLGQADPHAPDSRGPAALLRVDRIATQLAFGEFDHARISLAAATAEIDRLGAVVEPMLTALDCLLRLSVGELPEAEARAGLALHPRAERRLPDEVRLELLSVLVEVLIRRGRPDRARSLLDAERPVSGWPDRMQWIRLGCAAAMDPEPVRHLELLCSSAEALDHSLTQLVRLPHRGTVLVRALLRAGEPALARTVAGHLGTVAEQVDNPLWWGIAGHATGLVEGDPATVREAVARLRTTTARPALADALLDLARSPEVPPAEAAAAAQESAALYGRIGATGDQGLAQRHQRVLDGQSSRSARPRTGLDSLTGGEVRVAALLAGGATKREAAAQLFVSFHTVDSHLRAIYAKLGIRSRLELARIWDDESADPPA
ncbi:regulatory LuxR family protein [Micromonospora pisi]|uniref:Regulatory LuxR family protein n=1 Tax=Micromonospora pisi TaxID=589240 RepID=A0A495JHA6_9ACTN|nr:LuxR family transcriptional regulator [Micromonospora pisi]RKR88267.1 regulatory LuxR family protein [Micromonospora pisi]